MMRANGFTLIELLVAMAAGTLLLTAMSWAVARLNRDVARSQEGVRGQKLLVVSERLQALTSGARAGSTDTVTVTDGEVSFVTNPPLSLGAVGPVSATLRAVPWEGAQALELVVRAADGRIVEGATPSILLTGQRQIRFGWIDDRPPAETDAPALQIHLVDTQDRTTDLALPLHVTGDAACQFDPIAMTCR